MKDNTNQGNDLPDKVVYVQPIFVHNSYGQAGIEQPSLGKQYEQGVENQKQMAQQIWEDRAGIKVEFLEYRFIENDSKFQNFSFSGSNFRNKLDEQTNPNAVNVIFTPKLANNQDTDTPKWSLMNNVNGSVVAVSSNAVLYRRDTVAHAIGKGLGLKEDGIYHPLKKENILDDRKNLMTEPKDRQSPHDMNQVLKGGLSSLSKGQIEEARESPLVQNRLLQQPSYNDQHRSGQSNQQLHRQESQHQQNQIETNLQQTKQSLDNQNIQLTQIETNLHKISIERQTLQKQTLDLNQNAKDAGLNPDKSISRPIESPQISYNPDQNMQNSIAPQQNL